MIGYDSLFGRCGRPLDAQSAYRRRRQKRDEKQRQVANQNAPNLLDVADHEFLIEVYRQLAREGGQAPGPDGIRYRDLCPSEVALLTKPLAVAIRTGRYRPGASRQVSIPKAGGNGTRTLSIRDIQDRLAAKALQQVMTPFWEKIYLPNSFGFRVGLGVWDMLLAIELAMVTQNKWVVAQDDVKNAFDNVRISDVMEYHRQHLKDARLLDFIEANLRGGNPPSHNVGVEQGCPYSPTALNVFLHHVHDLGFRRDVFMSFYRYADNLVYLAQDMPEGLQALSRARDLLQPAGLTLKQENRPIELNEESLNLCGFQLFKQRQRLVYSLSENAFASLKKDLERTHTFPNPPRMAAQVIQGWLASYGPAFEGSQVGVIERVLTIASRSGFQEIGSLVQLNSIWQSSWNRWIKKRKVLGLSV